MLLGLFLGVAIALSLRSPLLATAQTSSPELRGVWLTNIDSDVLFSRRHLDRALHRLARLNFNTVYPTVWNWGYTLYPSNIAAEVTGYPVDPHPGFQQRDMLQEVVQLGHQRGLAVVPWFEFGLMAPVDSELALRHPDWLSRRQDGTTVWMQGKYPRVWLNPFHPQVQQLIVGLIGEIVSEYEIDGIQLDDHFGLPIEMGYDPLTVQLYRRSHNGSSPPRNPKDPEWMRWRADQMTRMMAQVFETVKARKSDCIIALSPNSREFAYQNFLQDWGNWERRGYVEELILQVYRRHLDAFTQELDRPEVQQARTHIPVGVGILTGLIEEPPIDTRLIAAKLNAVRDRRFAGVSFFFYETLNGRDAALHAMFPHPAQRPTVTHNVSSG
ncbi:MAG TPA: glycoside hydrolase family 10 protein [Synechococcales cyanobacterium M55_K2018_004]|nr:glycoside hydrolase family 10 protein [Synechococcales cyanobacterium M55_K2018_004]